MGDAAQARLLPGDELVGGGPRVGDALRATAAASATRSEAAARASATRSFGARRTGQGLLEPAAETCKSHITTDTTSSVQPKEGNPIPSRIYRNGVPGCQSPTRVLREPPRPDGGTVRRRRECPRCGHRFTTFERREPDPLHVVKRNGERQRFDRTKLRAALLKPPTSGRDARDIEAIVDRIETAVTERRGALLRARRPAVPRRSSASSTGGPISSSPERCRPHPDLQASGAARPPPVPSGPRARIRSPPRSRLKERI